MRDWHSLRHSFITNLAAGGVAPKLAQTLARHSTITLTLDRYTHTFSGDDAAALLALPDLDRPEPHPAAAVDSARSRLRNGSAERCEPARPGAMGARDAGTASDWETPEKSRENATSSEPMRLDAKRTLRDSNPQPTVPKTVALSN